MALRKRNIFNIKSINEIRIKLKQTQDKSKNRMVYKNKTEIKTKLNQARSKHKKKIIGSNECLKIVRIEDWQKRKEYIIKCSCQQAYLDVFLFYEEIKQQYLCNLQPLLSAQPQLQSNIKSLVKYLVTLQETSFDKYNHFRSVQFFKM